MFSQKGITGVKNVKGQNKCVITGYMYRKIIRKKCKITENVLIGRTTTAVVPKKRTKYASKEK